MRCNLQGQKVSAIIRKFLTALGANPEGGFGIFAQIEDVQFACCSIRRASVENSVDSGG